MSHAETFLHRSRHYLATEYPTKLRAAVQALPDEATWWRANEESNSVGNLLLHLNGNVRQWLLGGVGGLPVERQRSAEFAAREGRSALELLSELERTLAEADLVLRRLTSADLLARRTIQGRDVTVLEAVYHVVEHFALHLGQIIWVAKAQAPGSIRFYEDAAGLARPLWPSLVPPPA
jgi:uncharacterized damage-inducible protein DinB